VFPLTVISVLILGL